MMLRSEKASGQSEIIQEFSIEHSGNEKSSANDEVCTTQKQMER